MHSSMKMVAALVPLLVASGCGSAQQEPARNTPRTPDAPSIVITPELGDVHVGSEAPDFELPDQNGQPVRLSSLRGSVVMLAFTTSWCPFSTAEQPYLKQLAEQYAGRNVKVIAVNIDETDAGYRRYLARVALPFPVLHDARAQAVEADWAPERAVPSIRRNRWKVLVSSNLVIDPSGHIQFFTVTDTLHFDAELVHARRTIDRLLAEAPAAPAAAATPATPSPASGPASPSQ